MFSPIVLELLLLLLLLIANGVFAMSEIAVVSARKARLQQRAEQGDAGARAALDLANAPNRFLSTVQIGITLIGIFAGAFGGATIAQQIEEALSRYALLAPYGEVMGVVVVVLGTTYFSLVIGELVPKRLALNRAEDIAARIARPMHVLSVFASPVVQILTTSTDFVLRLLRAKASSEPAVTEEEITILIEQGIMRGTFKQVEGDIIERVFALDERRARNLMTPRTDIVWVNIDAPLDESLERMAQSGYAYFPLCRGSLDRTLGIISVKKLWKHMLREEAAELQTDMVPPLYVPENAPAFTLVRFLQEKRQHIALVIDEYGGVEGLISLTDILESIVGDFPSRDQQTEYPEIIQREDGSWLVDGLFQTQDLKEHFAITDLPGEGQAQYHTLGGFIMSNLERIPRAGDYFEWGGYRFEVVDMDGHRVDKVLIQKRPETE